MLAVGGGGPEPLDRGVRYDCSAGVVEVLETPLGRSRARAIQGRSGQGLRVPGGGEIRREAMNLRGRTPTWVGKLGGSLLEAPLLEDLPERVDRVVEIHGGELPVLVNGGGATVEQVRRWDATYGLGETFSHWLSVSGLTFNARALERILNHATLVTSGDGLVRAWAERCLPILCSETFLREVDEHRNDPLPRRWHVTSDSIAARVAEHLGAPTLALLKSTGLPGSLSREEAARRGFVDPQFPAVARKISRVVALDLRSPESAPVELLP